MYSRVEFWRTPADTVAPWLAAPPAHGFRAASALDRGHVAPIRCRVPAIDVQAIEMRNAAANTAHTYFRQNLKLALPPGSSDQLVEERLRLTFAVLHGTAVMLINHPGVYGLSKDAALAQLEGAFDIFLRAPAASPEA